MSKLSTSDGRQMTGDGTGCLSHRRLAGVCRMALLLSVLANTIGAQDLPTALPIAEVRPPAPNSTSDAMFGSLRSASPPVGDAYRGSRIELIPPEEYAGGETEWKWQKLPEGLIYRSYLAGGREPRLAGQWVYDREQGWLWDIALGGRAALLRYGTAAPAWAEGFEAELEGAALARLNWATRDLWTTDFRAGMPLAYRSGPWEYKFGYYHISSHLGDLYMLANPTWPRVRYVRDCLVGAAALRPVQAVRLYAETSWAFNAPGASAPWELQCGAEYSPWDPSDCGSPFLAANTLLREELRFSGSLRLEAGWQWSGSGGQLFRTGVMYFNGLSDQGQFYNRFEEQIGLGMWYDF